MAKLPMKITAFIFALTLGSLSVADPLHKAEDVLKAVYEAAGIRAEEATVVIFEYDYLSGQWHVELSPADKQCLDCFPAFYIKNRPELTVSKRVHG